MNEKQIAEIEARRFLALRGPNTAHWFVEVDALTLINEVRRLQAVVEKYADRSNWCRELRNYGVEGAYLDLWFYDEHGYTIAEECLREDGEE